MLITILLVVVLLLLLSLLLLLLWVLLLLLSSSAVGWHSYEDDCRHLVCIDVLAYMSCVHMCWFNMHVCYLYVFDDTCFIVSIKHCCCLYVVDAVICLSPPGKHTLSTRRPDWEGGGWGGGTCWRAPKAFPEMPPPKSHISWNNERINRKQPIRSTYKETHVMTDALSSSAGAGMS